MGSGGGWEWCNVAKYRFPLAPSANKYWRMAGGRVVVSSEAANYKITFKMLARCSTPRPVVLTGPVAVTIDVYRERKSGDLDNRIKICLDAMEGVFFENDSQVRELHAYLHEDRHDPRVEVTVTSLLNGCANAAG